MKETTTQTTTTLYFVRTPGGPWREVGRSVYRQCQLRTRRYRDDCEGVQLLRVKSRGK